MPGQNSSIALQQIVDDASSLGDVSPALATGGLSDGPSLSIATDVMQAMINGGPTGNPYNWKWNRFNVKPFVTISYQQDYFVAGLVNLGWMESCWAVNINQTSIPKQKYQVEVKRDLEVTSDQTGSPAKICWIPNDQMQTGTWGVAPLGPTANRLQGGVSVAGGSISGIQNPGPSVIYTNPYGSLQNPINATTCITDPSGNLWLLTGFGTCGTTQPIWPPTGILFFNDDLIEVNTVVIGTATTPVEVNGVGGSTAPLNYPTPQAPSTVATTVQDGTCVWTAINPKGQGFRLSPIPPQTGTVWLYQIVAQMRAPRFTSLGQTLEPIPDDYATHFKQGFFAECYRRNPDAKVRAKYPMERQMWLEELDRAVRQADREMDDVGFYPGQSIMDGGVGNYTQSPAYPFQR